jgi:hypothetical protein
MSVGVMEDYKLRDLRASRRVRVLVQKLGDNVVDFVFKTFVSIITSLGYVGNKPC